MSKTRDSTFLAGCILGVGAAAVQAYFQLVPPPAYGFCMVCHPKELVDWLANHLLNTQWSYALASANVPVLTVAGVILGASLAAIRHGELHLRPARRPAWHFVLGLLMSNFGLILGACPIRVVLLSAYGSILGILEWGMVSAGVGLAVLALRWHANRTA